MIRNALYGIKIDDAGHVITLITPLKHYSHCCARHCDWVVHLHIVNEREEFTESGIFCVVVEQELVCPH